MSSPNFMEVQYFMSGKVNLKLNLAFLIYRVNLEFPDCQDTQEDKDQR